MAVGGYRLAASTLPGVVTAAMCASEVATPHLAALAHSACLLVHHQAGHLALCLWLLVPLAAAVLPAVLASVAAVAAAVLVVACA